MYRNVFFISIDELEIHFSNHCDCLAEDFT